MSVAVEEKVVDKQDSDSGANAENNSGEEGEKSSSALQQSGNSTARANLHQLQNTWTLWFYKSDNSRKWEDNLRDVTKFDTVEEFWGLYNHIVPPANLQQVSV